MNLNIVSELEHKLLHETKIDPARKWLIDLI